MAWVSNWRSHEKVPEPLRLHEAKLGATAPPTKVPNAPLVRTVGEVMSSALMRRPNLACPVLSTRPRQVLSAAVQLALGAQSAPLPPPVPVPPPAPLPPPAPVVEPVPVVELVVPVVELVVPEV